MDSRERVKRALRRQIPDRVPRFDRFWRQVSWDVTAQAGVHPDTDLEEFFDLDIRLIGCDSSALLDPVTVREDETSIVKRDRNGATVRYLKAEQNTGEHLEFSITSPELWYDRYRHRYQWNRQRVDLPALLRRYKYWRSQGRYVMFSVADPFEATWGKCGPVGHMLAYAENPEWVRDMYRVHADLLEAAWWDLRSAGIEFDGAWFWADIAYKTSSMVSPKAYRELLQPFHRRMNDFVHQTGGETVLHSDGNLNGLLPDMLDAGFDCLQPMEVKAGMDVRDLKRKYGHRLAFMGNIDARLFQENDVAGLEAEIRSKLAVAKEGGGYLYHSDHSVPPGTTLQTYRAVQELLDRYGRY